MKPAFFLFSFLTIINLSGQSTLRKGQSVITAGYGFPNFYAILLKQDMQRTDILQKSLASAYGSTFIYSTGGFGPILIKYDYNISDKLGLGLVLGYFNTSVTEKYNYKKKL